MVHRTMQSSSTDDKGGRVLCVGLACLDLVTTVSDYPQEDSGQRCLDCVWQRGGNASNTSSVLALLGQPVEFFGTVSKSHESRFLRDDFASYGVHLDHIVECPDTTGPVCMAIVNTRNGSRTFIYGMWPRFQNNLSSTTTNLRELTYDDFKGINISKGEFRWIHFECRPTVPEIEKMLQHVLEYNKSVQGRTITTSLELEKPRTGWESLISLPDYLFLGKEFAQYCGYNSMEDAVRGFSAKCKPGATVICAWGEKGAAAKTTTSEVVTSPALKLDKVVDTLAAGDTFIAGTIFSLKRGDVSLREAIEYGCKVAGTKCGMRGLRGLADFNTMKL